MKKIKVLYVEDEPFLGKIVKESLETRDLEVNMIADGLQVLPAFEQYQPDICILDVMLPNVDGFTLGKQIRAKNQTIPILFLTAKVQTEDLINGFASGGNDYLKKPFSMEELIVRIKNLLVLTQQKKPTLSTPSKDFLSIGEFQFYPKRQELIIENSIQKLSHKETQLLHIFAQNINQTIERRSILKQVWGDDSFFNSRNLDVYIRKLRKYLEADDKVKILTLKGIGYRFISNS